MQVFESEDSPPDAEFGCFQIVYGPPSSDFAEEALLRLDVGEEHAIFTLWCMVIQGLFNSID